MADLNLGHLDEWQKSSTRSKNICAIEHENMIERDYEYSTLKISTEAP